MAILKKKHLERYLTLCGLADETKRVYGRAIRGFLTDVRPGRNGWKERAIAWKDSFSIAPKSVLLYVTAVRSFLEWCIDKHLVVGNPLRRVKIRLSDEASPRHPLSHEEVKTLLDRTLERGDEKAWRDWAAIVLMLSTGLRVSAVCGIDMEDMGTSGDARTLHYRNKGHSAKDSFVILNPEATAAIGRFLEHAEDHPNGGALFLTCISPRKRITASALRKALTKRMIEAGIRRPGIVIHSLRHTAATKAMKGGADLREVQAMLGHKSIVTTERYVHSLDRIASSAEMKIRLGVAGLS